MPFIPNNIEELINKIKKLEDELYLAKLQVKRTSLLLYVYSIAALYLTYLIITGVMYGN